jgi:hypothetical protein
VPELQANQPPPADYYAANLRRLLNHVLDYHRDLLSRSAYSFASSLVSASGDAQRLFARLMTRKGPWIRVDKLVYAEVVDRNAALEELSGLGLIRCNGQAPADFLLKLLTNEQRREVFPHLKSQRRDAWIEACVARYSDQYIRARLSGRYPWLAIDQAQHLGLCQLLFFGDAHQDSSTFVLQDLGLIRYPDYPLRLQDRMFASRRVLGRYQRLRMLRSLAHRLDTHPELAVYLSDQLWWTPDSRHEQRLLDRTLNTLGRHFERSKQFDCALSCYARSTSHPARERRVRILRKLADEQGAEGLLAAMQRSPRSSEEEDFVQRAAARSANPQTTTLCLNGQRPKSIERHAADLLSGAGGEAWHLENQLPTMLAGLAYWDIMFSPLPGAFVNPFQTAPLDLFWPDFAASRQQLLMQRDADFEFPGEFKSRLLAHHQCYQGLANRLVNWRTWPLERLQLLLEHVPETALRAIARHVIQQPYRAKTGFPDLLVIYGNGSYEFVEVKGPTDALQPAQRIWLQTLEAMGAPARVLKFKP